MTPAKRRPSTPASQGPTRVAPDVPIAPSDAAVAPAETEDTSQLLGADGEPVADEAVAEHAGGGSAPPAETGQLDHPQDRTTTESPRRPLSLYPLPVWPD